MRNNIILKPKTHIIRDPEDSEDEQSEQEPETPHDDVLRERFLKGGCVVQVPWIPRRAVENECLARKFRACADVVCFRELNGFVGAAVGETVYEDVARAAELEHGVYCWLEIELL